MTENAYLSEVNFLVEIDNNTTLTTNNLYNGNITTLKRYDENGVLFDDFTYHYINDIDAPNSPTNRLGYVGDVVSSTTKDYDIDNQNTGNYSYNAIGQLTSDVAEGITEVKWNNQGKVTEIIQSDDHPDTEFRYGPMGNRVVKVVKPKNNGLLSYQKDWKYTYYTRDAQGNVMAVYKRDELEALNQYNDDYYDRF
ncbi:MAG: hypothetical protein N4A35_11445, partial [Flavobacteriales bacterium]|nr:hypothetical protein [Flavobacteriales bacterium]